MASNWGLIKSSFLQNNHRYIYLTKKKIIRIYNWCKFYIILYCTVGCSADYPIVVNFVRRIPFLQSLTVPKHPQSVFLNCWALKSTWFIHYVACHLLTQTPTWTVEYIGCVVHVYVCFSVCPPIKRSSLPLNT